VPTETIHFFQPCVTSDETKWYASDKNKAETMPRKIDNKSKCRVYADGWYGWGIVNGIVNE